MPAKTRVSRRRTYTMRQLNQHTADVIREINDDGQPAAITRHGRFVAIVFPLAGHNVEARIVDTLIADTERGSQLTGAKTESGVIDTATLADRLDVTLPKYPDVDVD